MLKVSIKYAEVKKELAEGEEAVTPGHLRITEVDAKGKPVKDGLSKVLAEEGDFQEFLIGDTNALVLEEVDPE